MFVLPEWLPTRDNRADRAARRTLSGVTLGFIRERRAAGEDKGDLLSMLLATLAQHYRLALAPGRVVDTEPLIMLRPRYGMRMALSAR